MQNDVIQPWSELSEFRQALSERTPLRVHGIALLLLLTVSGSVSWMTWSQVNLIVEGTGRVRPLTPSDEDPIDVSKELSSPRAGHVVEMKIELGDTVDNGEVLVRLNQEHINNEISCLERTISTGEEKVAMLTESQSLLNRQYTARLEKARADLRQAETEIDEARRRREGSIRLAQIALDESIDKATRGERLTEVMSAEERFSRKSRVRENLEKLQQSQIPVNDSRVEALRRVLALIRRENEVEQQQISIEQRRHLGEVDVARLDLANLKLESQEMVIRAPFQGIVTQSDLKIGDMVQPGKIGITLVRQHGLQFEADVSSSDVAHLRPGMSVRIKLDAYDFQKYGVLSGVLRFVSPDSHLDAEDATQQKAVYKVRIALPRLQVSQGPHCGDIKLGMTGRAQIVTDQESVLMIFVRRIRRRISFG